MKMLKFNKIKIFLTFEIIANGFYIVSLFEQIYIFDKLVLIDCKKGYLLEEIVLRSSSLIYFFLFNDKLCIFRTSTKLNTHRKCFLLFWVTAINSFPNFCI